MNKLFEKNNNITTDSYTSIYFLNHVTIYCSNHHGAQISQLFKSCFG